MDNYESRVTAAGGIFYSQDTKKFLIARRADGRLGWAGWGGKLEYRETPEDTLRREVQEETSYKGPMTLQLVYTYKNPSLTYFNYLITVPKQFTPHLDQENLEYRWVSSLYDLPYPLHSGFEQALPGYFEALSKIEPRFSLRQKVLDNYTIEETKKYVRRKDRFYHPRDKEGRLDPRNGGFEDKGVGKNVISEKDTSNGRP